LYALVESAVDCIHNLASGYIDQEQVGSIAHPLKARLRRRQAKGGPVTVIISRREEHRRQYRADHPAPVAPAAWIEEGSDVNRVEWTTVIHKALWQSTWTRSSEFTWSWRST
jgi:hypothetical protein